MAEHYLGLPLSGLRSTGTILHWDPKVRSLDFFFFFRGGGSEIRDETALLVNDVQKSFFLWMVRLVYIRT